MVITRSKCDAAEVEEQRRAQLQEAARIERERLQRVSLEPPASPFSREADAITPGPSGLTKMGSEHVRTRSPARSTRSVARSVRSNRSTTSAATRLRMVELEAAEKLAALKKKEFAMEADLKQKEFAIEADLKRKELEIEADLVKRRLAVEASAINDEESVYDEQLADALPREESLHRVDNWLTKNPLTSRGEEGPKQDEAKQLQPYTARGRSPKPTKSSIDQLAATLDKMTRPRPRYIELPIFSGATNEWLSFHAAVRDSTQMYGISAPENIQRLRSCLRGGARDAVAALLHTATDPEVILKTLEQRFGRPEAIIDKALDDLKRLPKPGSSATELNIFAIDLQNIICVLQTMDMEGYLRNPQLAREVLDKLSPHLRSRWCDYACDHEQTTDPKIVVLSRFLMREADRALRHSYAPTTCASSTKKEMRPNVHMKKKATVYAAAQDTEANKDMCPICDQDHLLIACPKYKALSVEQRWRLVREKGICYKCAQRRHRRLTCKAKLCGVNECRRPHHSSLHMDVKPEASKPEAAGTEEPPREEAVLSVATRPATGPKTVLLKVCPVIISGPRGEVKTHAFLDEGATITLVDEELAASVGATGPAELLDLSGINTTQSQRSQRVTLTVRRWRSDEAYTVKARTVKGLRLRKQSIPDTLLDYDHLRDLTQEEVCYNQARPGLLVGTDHWECIVSRELRIGGPNEPAASRTQLGWVVHGTVPRRAITEEGSVLHVYEPQRTTGINSEELHDVVKAHVEIDALGTQERPRIKATDQRAIDIVNKTDEKVLHIAEESGRDSWLPDPARFSKYETLVRSAARVLAFTDICRRRATRLEHRHVERAEVELIRRAQVESFRDEMARIKSARPLPRSSRLYRLDPVLEDGVLRVRGRIEAASAPIETKRPVILDGRHRITKLLVMREHCAAGHANRERVTNDLRQRYWVIHLRPTVRAVEKSCALCRRRRAAPQTPATGDLPHARLDPFHRPFTNCGVDYFGPMMVKVGRRREKRWGALFTCLTSRAVHLELAASLSTDSAIMALRRMAARRGWPRLMYSDNGTNFRGADQELRAAYEEWLPALQDEGLLHRMEWRFIPPGAPNQGGAWERMVRSVKAALGATLHERAPAEEVLQTLLTEAEFSVNARPLTHVSVNPADPEALTPNHFLLGSSTGLPSTGPCDEADRRVWRASMALADHFWRRWLREYLPTLVPRGEPKNDARPLQVGDVVLIVDSTLPRNTWPMGVVERTHPGPDGGIRVVEVRTRTGVFRRPVSKLVVVMKKEATQAAPGGEL